MKLVKFFFRALTAIILVAGLVALPVGLVGFVGWPGPTSVLSWAEIERLLDGQDRIPPSAITKTLAVVAWGIWGQLVWCSIQEINARRQNLLAANRWSLPGIRHLTAAGIVALTLVVNGFRSSSPVAAQAVDPAELVIDDATPHALNTSAADTTIHMTYTTRPGDSWWSITERTFNDGTRWAEIRDLNVGRTFDDFAVTATTDYLGVGWDIALPENAQLAVTVKQGDSINQIANNHNIDPADLIAANPQLEDPHLILPGQQLDLPDASQPRLKPPLPPTNLEPEIGPPSTSQPRLKPPLPPTNLKPPLPPVGPAPSLPETPGEIIDVAASNPPVKSGPAAADVGIENSASNPLDAITTFGSETAKAVRDLFGPMTLLAPAMIAIRQRRQQRILETTNPQTELSLRTRPKTDATPKVLAPLDEDFAVEITVAAGLDDLTFLELILKLVGEPMTSRSIDLGIIGVFIGSGHADVVFQQTPTIHPAVGFELTDHGRWRIERPDDLTDLRYRAGTRIVPTPAMVTFGAQNGVTVALNLEALGGINLVGDPKEVNDFAATIAAELAMSPLPQTMRVLTVGWRPPFEGLDRINEHDTLPAGTITSVPFSETPALDRLRNVDYAWHEPRIVFISTDEPTPTGVAAIPVTFNRAKEPGITQVVVSADSICVPALKLDGLEPPRTSLKKIEAFIQTADNQREPDGQRTLADDLSWEDLNNNHDKSWMPPWNQPNPHTHSNIWDSATSLNPSGQPYLADSTLHAAVTGEYSVADVNLANQPSPDFNASPTGYQVGVLGPVQLDGTGLDHPGRAWKSRKTAELIVMLAIKKQVTGTKAKHHLWPGRPVDNVTTQWASVVSETRQLLGIKFPAGNNDVYNVFNVGTDYEQFTAYEQAAQRATHPAAAQRLRQQAVDLIRGAPFQPREPFGYGWVEQTQFEMSVTMLATIIKLTASYRQTNQHRHAVETAEIGLALVPHNYALLQHLGQAALGLQDNTLALQAVNAIEGIDHDWVEGTPGLPEPELPTSLLETLTALKARIQLANTQPRRNDSTNSASTTDRGGTIKAEPDNMLQLYRHLATPNSERGSVSISAAIFAVAFVASVLAVINHYQHLQGLRDAREVSFNASRAAVQQLDQDSQRSENTPVVAQTDATAAASQIVTTHDNATLQSIDINGDTVEITVSVAAEGILTTRTFTGTSQATALDPNA